MADRPATLAMDREKAWDAVLARDEAFNRRFVYAVKTTGVFCRPSCPARRPRRENVEIFATPREAERQGYRACRRCRPDSADGSPAERAVDSARRYLDRHADTPVTLERLADEVGLSPSHLQRTFKRLVGMSPREYQRSLRFERFREESRRGPSVLAATHAAGFGSSRGLYDHAREELGMTPATYRRGGAGLRITWATARTDLGLLLVAATADGVCAVFLGDDSSALERELRGEFPNAELAPGGDELDESIRALAESMDDGGSDADVPLDLLGTDFQRQVWHALRRIPRGKTMTYGALAAALGRPTAARAVAQACARNHVSIAVPCHRVIREDGGPGGYRWGIERKLRLLERERA